VCTLLTSTAGLYVSIPYDAGSGFHSYDGQLFHEGFGLLDFVVTTLTSTCRPEVSTLRQNETGVCRRVCVEPVMTSEHTMVIPSSLCVSKCLTYR